jgi:hypothetical protein
MYDSACSSSVLATRPVMTAGAIPAQVGSNHAFEHGADFVIAGMFDFQLTADVEIVVKALKRTKLRERPWRV